MAAAAGTAQAQTGYPGRAITMVVPLPAGGTADLLCRLAADKAGGASGSRSWSRTGRAAPAAASAPSR